MTRFLMPIIALSMYCNGHLAAGGPSTPPQTTLSDKSIKYTVASKPYVVLNRSDVRAVIVDNQAVDDKVLPGHRGGYSGVASLTHTHRKDNLFVPAYAGLNFEHIHDGTVQDRKVLFEPRNAPMQLRVIDQHTVELYQAPTPHWKLESCARYELLADGTIQLIFECIPRAKTFSNGHIGLFWASYIHQPESLDIHFKGLSGLEPLKRRLPPEHWIQGVTPAHGKLSTHRSLGDHRSFKHDKEFPLTLVFNMSDHRYWQPWYYGVSHELGLLQVFRLKDKIRFSQSPSGGGKGNPAWDFQFLIPNYQVDKTYGFVMRASYLPYRSKEQMEKAAANQQRSLEPARFKAAPKR